MQEKCCWYIYRSTEQVITIYQYDMDGGHGSKQVILDIYEDTRRN